MHEGLFIAASGGRLQQRKMEVISHNLANLSSAGFKKDSLVFREMLTPFDTDQKVRAKENNLLDPMISSDSVSYAAVTGFATDYSQGSVLHTGNGFDIALEGDGFFAVQTDDGIRYTRKGNFHLNDQNQMVNSDGLLLLSSNDDSITIPPGLGDLSIDVQGTLSISDGLQSTPLGQLKLVRFEDKSKLVKQGDGLVRPVNQIDTGAVADDVQVRQGFVENANVSVVSEMTEMMLAVRTFEAYQKIIQTIDELDGQSINSIARVA